ncbi:MAG: DUF2892 domain-containing protein [Halioglobus sp.]
MSIERNLGNVERVIRLALGGCLLWLAVTSPSLNGIEWFVGIISTALILNGVFSRCYLWYVLDIDTSGKPSGSCLPEASL